ncbi:unnamed protein product [Adineta steineri]|uniref:Homeobox domain-containing protein n=1 Tax=Adineta steineri TaxID=433720 RepID=A0A815TF43_9BILA|nr:unnamed protein product [Adineta steineri]
MNNSYISCFSNDYPLEYSSPLISTYYYSSSTSCPIHSSYPFYSSPTQSINTSSPTYSHYRQQIPTFFPSVEQPTTTFDIADRTPLRQHKCFKKNELEILHQIYIQNAYPSIDILQQLSEQLKVSVDKIRQWFKNRRHSDKRKKQTSNPRI